MTLEEYLKLVRTEHSLISVILTFAEAVKGISELAKATKGEKAGTDNVFGEQQLALDVQSDDLMFKVLEKNPYVGLAASEERETEEKIGKGEYAVAFDPLDGSSLVDADFSVGTVGGIYKSDTLLGLTGDDQLCSMAAVYGPRTVLNLTVKEGLQVFVLSKKGEFILLESNLKVGSGKMFAPGNLRACSVRPDYMELISFWCKKEYTLRYSGGMVPDIHHIFVKGKGIFSYPGYGSAPDGKLRLLYECAPLALLMEQAGGAATDGEVRILEKKIKSFTQRTPIFIGSKEEVKRCEDFLS